MKKRLQMLVLLLAALLTAACGAAPGGNSQPAAQQETQLVKHKQGETAVGKRPRKVVVFDLGVLDSLDRLGVDVIALPKTVLPAYLAKYKADTYVNAGNMKEPDFEKINSLKPDLIIISDRQAPAYKELSAIAPTINLQVDASNFMNSFESNMRLLGSLFAKQEQVEQELKQIEAKIATVNAKAKAGSERALIIMTTGGKLHAFGPGSRFALVHDVLGLKSVMAPSADKERKDIHGKIVTFEYIADVNPDYLFVIDRDDAIGQSAAAKQLLDNDLVRRTKAARNGKIVYLNSGMWYLSGGGLTSVASMVDEVAGVVR